MPFMGGIDLPEGGYCCYSEGAVPFVPCCSHASPHERYCLAPTSLAIGGSGSCSTDKDDVNFASSVKIPLLCSHVVQTLHSRQQSDGRPLPTSAIMLRWQDLVTIEALTAQEENAEADKLVESLQNGVGGAVNTRMCYMCFDDVDEASNPLVSVVPCHDSITLISCTLHWFGPGSPVTCSYGRKNFGCVVTLPLCRV